MKTWLALLEHEAGARRAEVLGHGPGRWWLCSWEADERPHREALAVDPLLVGDAGPACRVSLLVLPAGQRPIADDPAVVGCRRDVLRDLRLGGSSLLTDDPVHVAGAIVCAPTDRPDQVLALKDNPYRRLGRPLDVDVAGGLLTPHPPALGPVVERYAGSPWPHDRW